MLNRQQMLEKVYTLHLETMRNIGDGGTSILTQDADGGLTLFTATFHNEEEKNRALELVGLYNVLQKTQSYALATESWVLTGPQPGDLEGQVADHPDRKEVLFCAAIDRMGSESLGWELVRDGEAHINLRPVPELSGGGAFGGRFASLLPAPGRTIPEQDLPHARLIFLMNKERAKDYLSITPVSPTPKGPVASQAPRPN